MKKCIDGKIIEMTAEEIEILQEEIIYNEEAEKNRIPSNDERISALESAILNILGVI